MGLLYLNMKPWTKPKQEVWSTLKLLFHRALLYTQQIVKNKNKNKTPPFYLQNYLQ